MRRYHKDSEAVLDYGWNFSHTDPNKSWLGAGETIVARTVTISGPDALLVLDSTENTSTTVTAWLSGGTVGATYLVTCEITTSNATPRTDQRTMKIIVIDR